MKFLTMLSILISFQAYAKVESSFLTLQEFQSLSRQQQAQYLKSVQKIMAVMTKQSLYMASQDDVDLTRLPAASKENTSEKEKAMDELIATQTKKHLDKAYDDINQENAVGFKIGIPPVKQASADKPPQETPSTNPVPLKVATPNKVGAETPPASATPTKESPPDQAPAKIESVGTSHPVPNQTEIKPQPIPEPKAARVQSKQEVITETKQEQGRTLSPEELKTKSTGKSIAAEKTEPPPYRCMYSGWVLKTDPCKPQENFPEDYSIDVPGLDMKKMNCKGQTMCNPTLFGLKISDKCKSLRDCAAEAKPICVPTGAWPTEKCYELSTFKDATVAAEINDELNPIQYANFVEDFANLCSDEKIKTNPFAEMRNGKKRNVPAEVVRRDIKLTCGWAVKKMTAVNAAMKVEGAEGRRKWATEKEKSGPKKSKPPEGTQQ